MSPKCKMVRPPEEASATEPIPHESRYTRGVRSLASSLITIVVNVAYIADVLRHHLGLAALLVALPYLLSNLASVSMFALSLFSRPIRTDERWSMFAVAIVASNLFVVLHFSGIKLVSPNANVWVSFGAQLAILALVPFYVFAVITLGKQLTVMPEARELITRGPYAISRHPLYVTYVIWYALQIPATQSWVVAGLSAVMTVLLVVRARSEEALLSSTFPEYADYRERVGWVGHRSPRLLLHRVERDDVR